MKLNLPILDQLADSKSILIAGIGGGFDVLAGLPLYFTLRALGKTVHLANYTFCDLELTKYAGEQEILIDQLCVGAKGMLNRMLPYHPEGYLSQWFKEVHGEDVTVWMFAKVGALPLAQAYTALVKHLEIDAIIAVDGGVDSLMVGDEYGAGTLVEDAISMAAIDHQDVPVKLQACVGFGTEVEEGVCHYLALENIAGLAREGGFLGSCALTPQMEAFQLYEAACRYIWEQPNHPKSHISTRIIPAVHGEFGNYHLYPDSRNTHVLISPLMSLYWFFDANAVINRSKIIDAIRDTITLHEAFATVALYKNSSPMRQRRGLPY
jgi:hypothetical protein